MIRKAIRLIHTNRYVTAVLSFLWNIQRLDAARLALRRDNIADAARHGRVFELKPIPV
jgi:hypothetical protein